MQLFDFEEFEFAVERHGVDSGGECMAYVRRRLCRIRENYATAIFNE